MEKDMRTRRHYLGLLPLAATLLLAACNQENILENKDNGSEAGQRVAMTFTAGTAQTRTALQPGNEEGYHEVHWQAGDAISVLSLNEGEDGTLQSQQGDIPAFTTTDNGAIAQFTGEAIPGIRYMAFYPGDEQVEKEISFYHIDIGYVLDFDVNANLLEQPAMAGSYVPWLNLAWAQTNPEEMNFQFHNLMALVKFRLAESDDISRIATVSLADNAGTLIGDTYISGSLLFQGYNPNTGKYTGTQPFYWGTYPYVRMTAPQGGFQADTDYYFVVYPADGYGNNPFGQGLTLTFATTDGQIYSQTSTQPAMLTASEILNLGTIALGTFQSAITNTAFVKAVGSQVNWTVNADGTVTLNEDNLNAINATTSLDIRLKQLTDLSGIEYFNGLTSLDCSHNLLTSLDVSGLTQLTSLNCSGNDLTSLDVSGLTQLFRLDCSFNDLTSLDVSELTQLTSLNCSFNDLISLDVSGLTRLTQLDCYSNSLTSLDVSKLTSLYKLSCYNNLLSKLDLTNNTSLMSWYCGKQFDGQGGDRTLSLYLLSAQEEKWNEISNHWTNENVEVIWNPYGAGHEGFGEEDWEGSWNK